jgi:ubiquinone/menaquinone biosynthesis C-methylase UbiE
MRPALLIALLAGLLQAQNPVPTTDTPTTYMGREMAATMHWMGAAWLIRHKRDREEASVKMRAALDVKPGMTVCDMGCGNGYHTLPLAKAVGEAGKVYAVDIQPEMLRMLDEKTQQEKVTNITPILGAEADPKLPDGSCDLILMVDVYHEFSQPGVMLQAMKKALKPGGQLVLVEFRSEDPEVPIKPEHKMSKAQIEKELTANGYELSRSYEELPWQHMVWYRAKP